MKLVNLTAHPVVLYDMSPCVDGGRVLGQWVPSGDLARLPERTVAIAPADTDQGIMPTVGLTYHDGIEGLPASAEGTGYLVSRVLAAEVSRSDVYFPYGEVRDQAGRIIGCRALGQFVTGGGA